MTSSNTKPILIHPIPSFDIESNWKSLCVPHLKNLSLWTSIVNGLLNYCPYILSDNAHLNQPVSFCTSINNGPSSFTSRMSETIGDDYLDVIIKTLDQIDLLPKRYFRLDDEDDVKYQIDRELLMTYAPWKWVYDEPELYRISGQCHTWNPTFTWTLAHLVFPDVKWMIRSNELHTTIVDQDQKMYFDPLVESADITQMMNDKPFQDYNSPDQCPWLKHFEILVSGDEDQIEIELPDQHVHKYVNFS